MYLDYIHMQRKMLEDRPQEGGVNYDIQQFLVYVTNRPEVQDLATCPYFKVFQEWKAPDEFVTWNDLKRIAESLNKKAADRDTWNRRKPYYTGAACFILVGSMIRAIFVLKKNDTLEE